MSVIKINGNIIRSGTSVLSYSDASLSSSGGVITYDGDYRIHTFTDSSTITIRTINPYLSTLDVSVLIVGGGGRGGYGGGGGGKVNLLNMTLVPNSYSVFIGGASADSSFNGTISVCGSTATTSGVGGNSGSGMTGGALGNASGGGAGETENGGYSGASYIGGDGGHGLRSTISGVDMGYGGGGSGFNGTANNNPGNAFDGGGVALAPNIPRANSGGGGGGYAGGTGAVGASGIVIIRYKYR